MAKLYEMTNYVAQLYEMLEAGEIDEEIIKDTIEAMGVDEKVEGYCQVIKQLLADASMFKDEIDRLTARKKSIENNAEWLKKQLLDFYVASGSKEIKAGTFKVTTRKNEYVDIPDESKIPKKYLTVKVSPNKTDIKAAIKSGVKVRGAAILTRESIQIK